VVTTLLDINVLVALSVPDHVHNEVAEQWLRAEAVGGLATCPLTQLGLVRLLLRFAVPIDDAYAALEAVVQRAGHEFWPDELPVERRRVTVTGHRQVTDAYLAALARHHQGRLATFDRAIGALHPDVAVVVPT
jgi:toxin-antitoxin system PIN domain toxin